MPYGTFRDIFGISCGADYLRVLRSVTKLRLVVSVEEWSGCKNWPAAVLLPDGERRSMKEKRVERNVCPEWM